MKTKRILSILLVLAMALSLLPTAVFATGTTYAITNGTKEGDKDTNHGYIVIDKTTAAEGETVTITVNPASGYQLKSLTVVPVEPVEPVEYVEIGGLKWATMNLGATTVAGSYTTCYGDLYQWGSVKTLYNGFTLTSATEGSFTTWKTGKKNGFTTGTREYIGNDATLPDANDVVKQTYPGTNWRMPTSAEFQALYDACGGSYDKTTNPSGASASVGKGIYWCTNYDGVKGVLFCDGTNKLFFPTVGYGTGTHLNMAGSRGCYWSSSLDTSSTDKAYRLSFNSDSVNPQDSNDRYYGHSVRPVKDAAPANKLLESSAPVDPETITPEKQQGGTYQFTMPGCAVTVKAEFEEAAPATTYAITDGTAQDAHGSISFDKATAAKDDTVTITVNPASGYQLKSLTVTPVAPTIAGSLTGVFSVSADKKVQFSQGNLVATIDASGAPTAWKFAANQYDCLGEGGANKNIGSAAGDVDLFGWSTASTTYGINTSNKDSDYSGAFKDWGTAIDGNGTWRTLSQDEWAYLINTKNDETIRKGKYKNEVTICGKTNCLILVPDECLNGYSFDNTKTSYTVEEWATAEAAGLVCLPAAGRRSGSEFKYLDPSGFYWSSTASADDVNSAHRLFFNSSSNPRVNPYLDVNRFYGYSVRLVTSASVDPETITPEKQQGGTYQFTMPGCAVTVTAEFEAAGPQKIGDSDVTWELSNNDTVLTLGGTGAMPDFALSTDIPWYSAKDTITTVKVGSGITRFGENAFSGCKNIVNLYIEDLESWCKIEFADSFSHPFCYNTLNNNLYVNGNPATDLVIPDTITEIKDYAFALFNNLTSVTIPSSVTSIGKGAFEGCTALTSITIPTSVTSIGDQAFYSCKGLTSVTIPTSVTSIGEVAFMDCTGLTSVTIPASVTSIGGNAFAACTALTSATISSGVTSIGGGAFASCPKLTSVTIPSSVTEIGGSAFTFVAARDDFCASLTTVTVKATTPPTLSGSVFPVSNAGFKVYVPYGKLTDYQNAAGWKSAFLKRCLAEAYVVDDKPTTHGTVAISKDCFPSDTYTAAKETVNVTVTPDEGYQLKSLKYNDGTDHDITNAKSFTMPLANVTLTAEFEIVTAPQYKYTTYQNWQLKHEGSEWHWTENLTKVDDGLFILTNADWTGSGFNVASDTNPIKKDWYAANDPDVTIAEEVLAPVTVDIYLRVIDDETLKIGIGEAPPAPAPAKTPVTEIALTVGSFTRDNLASPPADLLKITSITAGNEDINGFYNFYFLDKDDNFIYAYDVDSSLWVDSESEPLQGTPDYDKIATAMLMASFLRKGSDETDFADDVTVTVNGGSALAKTSKLMTTEGYKSYGDELSVSVRFDLPKDAPVRKGVQLWENGPYWATYNIGATNPEEVGDYFMWGATEKAYTSLSGTTFTFGSKPASYQNTTWEANLGFRAINCPYTDGVYENFERENVFTKYTNNDRYAAGGTADNKTELESCDDAATANWGAGWRMPTNAEFTAIRNNCYAEWTNDYAGTSVKGVIVYKVKDAADKGIYGGVDGYDPAKDACVFFPATGSTNDLSALTLINPDSGYYWGSTNGGANGYGLSFSSFGLGPNGGSRWSARAVRAVSDTDPNPAPTKAPKMPENVEVKNGKIKSGDSVVEVKTAGGTKIPSDKLQDVAEAINNTLDNKAVSEFTGSGIGAATSKNDSELKNALKALTQDKTAQANLESTGLSKRLEIELKGAEVSDPENPMVEKMTVVVTPVAIAKVEGSDGEVELKTTINDSDIEEKITVRMPVDSKNDSKTVAIYDKDGKFLGNFEVKEDSSKYVEFKTESAGEFTYITLNGKTTDATVNGTLYASVEDALSEITDGQTVELTKDVTEKVTVNKTGTFTINDNGHSIEIEAGKGLKLTKNGNTYTVEEIGSNTEMPKQTEVTPGGEIKSGDTVVDVKDSEGKSIPNEKKQAVATQINETLNNEAVEKFTKSGIEKAVEGKEEELKDEMKSQSSDQTALANLESAELKTYLEMELKGAEVLDPEDPVVEKMTIEVTPVAVAKVQGSTGEVEFKTPINNSDIEEPITVRMPVDSKNDSKTAAVYDKDGKFLGNFPIKVENGNKFVELETKTAGEFKYLTLNENTTGAKIGTRLYATAEDALSEISDGQTLNITKDVQGNVTISKECSFTINDNGHTVNIVPAEGYTLTKEGNTYTIFNKANVPEMPAEVEISGGKIKSDDKVVDVKDNEGNSIPRENLQAVADEINNTLDNKAVEEFTKNGLNKATEADDEELMSALKALTQDKTAQENLENAKLTKRLEIELKGAEVSDPENPIVEKMTVVVTPVAIAKVQGSDGEVEVKTTIKDKDINDEIIVRMPVDSKNESETAAVYDKNGTFLGNYPVKIEDGNKFVEFETNTTGEMSYLTLNEKTSGASVDGTLYANAGDAVSEAKSGDTVTVTKDFKEVINVSKEITFDDVEGTHKVSVLPSIGYKYRQIDNKHIIEPGNRTETPEKLEVKSDIIKSGNTVVDVKDGEGKEIPNEKKQTVAEAINKVFENENFEKSSAVGIEKATVRKVSEIVKDLKEKTSDTVARNNITEKSVNKYLTVSLVSAGIKSASDVVVESMVLEVTPMATVTVKGRNGEVVTVTSPIANEEINGTVKFNLPIDIQAKAELVAVYHEDEFVGNRPVLEDENKNQYVEVETDSFSLFSYVVLNEKNAAASINGKLYLTLSDAIKEVKDNEEIKLLKDVTETVTVEREVSFTINSNGKTNNATIIPGEKFNKLPQSGNSFKVEAIGKPEMPEQTEVTPGGDIKSGDNVVEVKGENGESIPDDKKPAVVEEINNTLDNKAVKSFNQSGLEKATARSDSKLEQALKSQTTDPTALENLEKAELTKYLEVELKKVDVNDPSNPVVESMTVDVKAMASAKVEGTNGEIELKTPISSESIKEEIVVRMPVSGNNNSDTAALYDENGTFLGNYEVKEENGNKYIEFKTKNVGEFTYRTINEKNSGASINGTLYASVEDALSEIIDGQTVNITKDVKENITISHEGTFTVNDNGHTVEIVAGSGYKLTKNGNTYTITKKSSGGGGGGISSYTIKFETNGGNTLKNVSVKVGQKIGTIGTPVKEGFVFDGWFSDKELTKPFNADDKVTKSTTLYAGWKVDPVRQIILTIGQKTSTVFGKEKTNDVAPKIVNDRTMLPIRFIAEALGATVDWNGEKELVTISNEGLKIEITIGKDVAFVKGKEVKLDSPAFIENDRTYLPLRFVAENLGAEVGWVEEAQQVVITKALPEKTTTK